MDKCCEKQDNKCCDNHNEIHESKCCSDGDKDHHLLHNMMQNLNNLDITKHNQNEIIVHSNHIDYIVDGM